MLKKKQIISEVLFLNIKRKFQIKIHPNFYLNMNLLNDKRIQFIGMILVRIHLVVFIQMQRNRKLHLVIEM